MLEKNVTPEEFAITHVFNGKGKLIWEYMFVCQGCKQSMQSVYVSMPLVELCFQCYAIAGVTAYTEHCVFPVKMAGIRSSVIALLRQALQTSKANFCALQAFTACEGHLWYPSGCFSSLPFSISWLQPLANSPFPRDYLYFHLLLPLRMMIAFPNLFLKITVGEMGPRVLIKLSLRGGDIKAAC